MRRRQPLPRLWLMTDERQGDALWAALKRLPEGSGVVFRHYSLSYGERRRLFGRVLKVARRRRLLLLLAGPARQAAAWGADGSHGRGPAQGLRSAPAHDLAELRTAERNGAAFAFLSPAFATRSHPEKAVLGPVRLGLIACRARLPVIALGGMDAGKARRLRGLRLHGWAAIDAWSRD